MAASYSKLPYDNRAPLLEPTKANNTRHLRIKRPVFKCVINDDSDDNDSDKLEYLWDGAILNVTEFKCMLNLLNDKFSFLSVLHFLLFIPFFLSFSSFLHLF